MIKDSGDRKQFESGAVRDVAEGKGRCDLLPLDVVSELLSSVVLDMIHDFIKTGDEVWLLRAARSFGDTVFLSPSSMILEVAVHFEEGCEKYGERNWEKGLPLHCYIDSAVRHYLKYVRGDDDERHDRAFVWNLLCAVWTIWNRPEMIDIAFEEVGE